MSKELWEYREGTIYWSREIFRKETTEDLPFSTSFVFVFVFFLRKESDNTIGFFPSSASEQVALICGGAVYCSLCERQF